jgi:hypothetical protein
MITASYDPATDAITLLVDGIPQPLPPAEAARVVSELCQAIAAYKVAHGISKKRSVLKPALKAEPPSPVLRHTHTATPKRLRPLPPADLTRPQPPALADLVPLRTTGRRR